MTKVRCMDLPESDRGDFSCRRAVDSSSLIYMIENSLHMVQTWFRQLPSIQTPKLAYENSMLGVFSCDITVVANDVIMQRTQRCLGLSETRQVNRYIVVWLARALLALEASQHVIGLPLPGLYIDRSRMLFTHTFCNKPFIGFTSNLVVAFVCGLI